MKLASYTVTSTVTSLFFFICSYGEGIISMLQVTSVFLRMLSCMKVQLK